MRRSKSEKPPAREARGGSDTGRTQAVTGALVCCPGVVAKASRFAS